MRPKTTNRGRRFPDQKRRRKFRPDSDAVPGFTLTDRDREIIRAVAEYRFLTGDHVRALIDGSGQGITRRLAALFHTKHLTRLQPTLRVRLLAGHELRPPIVYALSTAGRKALLDAGVPEEELPWRPDWNLTKQPFLEHGLAVANFRVCLELALEGDGAPAELTGWLDEEELKDAVSVHKPTGRGEVVYRVGPDGFAAVRVAGANTNIFLELDRGHEEHSRLSFKFRSYRAYFSEGSPYWTRYEEPQRRLVLFLTTTERRLSNMIATLANVPEFRGKGLKQFWFGLEDDFSVKDRRILSPLWRRLTDIKVDDNGRVAAFNIERKALFTE